MDVFRVLLGLQVIRDGIAQPTVPFPWVLVLWCTYYFVPVRVFVPIGRFLVCYGRGLGLSAKIVNQRTKQTFRYISTADDGSVPKPGPAAGPTNGGDSVNVLVDSGATGLFFDNAVIPKERDTLKNYQVINVPVDSGTSNIWQLFSFSRHLGMTAVSRRAISHQHIYGVAAVSEATPPRRAGRLQHQHI